MAKDFTIEPAMLTAAERDWVNAYHAEVLAKVAPNCSDKTQAWLKKACAPI